MALFLQRIESSTSSSFQLAQLRIQLSDFSFGSYPRSLIGICHQAATTVPANNARFPSVLIELHPSLTTTGPSPKLAIKIAHNGENNKTQVVLSFFTLVLDAAPATIPAQEAQIFSWSIPMLVNVLKLRSAFMQLFNILIARCQIGTTSIIDMKLVFVALCPFTPKTLTQFRSNAQAWSRAKNTAVGRID